MPYHVYVSNAGSQFLSHFLLEERTGALAPQPDIQLAGAPGAVATNAAGTRLYACLRSQQQIASYAVDRGTGGLTQTGAVDLPDGPPYLYVERTDRYLLAAYYRAGAVSVHGIAADGTLSAQPLQWLETEGHAHSVQTDRSNRFAFVPHTVPANAIYQFRFDAQTGALTPNDPPKVQPVTPEGPRHIALHPTQGLVYSVNEDGSTVSAHRLDPVRGTLDSFQVISTLPGGRPVEGNSTAEIRITADGKHLYASNRGHDSLALFAVAADGRLVARGHYPTEATPRFFAIDPTGGYLYAAGQGSGRLAAFRLDRASGALDRIATHEVGSSPLWIQFVRQQ